MSKTPSKSGDCLISGFTPKELKTPSKDLPGISKTVFTHISSIHGLLTDWVRLQDKGTKICKMILALKLHECNDDYYPHQLGPLTESLLNAIDSFKNIVDGIEIINKQLNAVAKIQLTPQPIIFTWSADQIHKEVNRIHKCALKEYAVKKTITENLAHCRDEKLIDVYVSAWEMEAYFNIESTAYLFVEVGLSGIL